jgi:hypothetical protein
VLSSSVITEPHYGSLGLRGHVQVSSFFFSAIYKYYLFDLISVVRRPELYMVFPKDFLLFFVGVCGAESKRKCEVGSLGHSHIMLG